MIVTHKVSMDLLKSGIQPQIDVVQDDQFSRKIAISLYTNGVAWEIPAEAAVLVQYRKPDGKGGQYDALPDGGCAWEIRKNVLTIALAPQVTTVAGQVQLSASLVLDAQILSTFTMALNVRRSVRAEMAESACYFNVTGFLPVPENAEIGQYLQVSSVDGSGKVTGVEAVEPPAYTPVEGSGVEENIHALLNSWNGKTWYVLGDSISAEASLSAGHTKKLYHRYVKEYLGFGKVVNLAASGHSLGQNSSASSNNVVAQLSKIGSDADLITIFAGVNDRWFNVPLGEEADTDVTTVYGALNTICTYLLENFSDRQLLFITPTKENNASCAAANTTGVTVEQIADAVRNRCAAFSIDCLDAHAKSGIYPKIMVNAGTFTSDKLHLNTNGHKRLAQMLTGYLLGKGSYQYAVPAEQIILSAESLVFANSSAGYQTLTAAVIPENTTEVLSWKSSNTSVATVNIYGAVFPQGAGTCVITATCGNITADCVVNVGGEEGDTVVVESVVLNKSTGTLTVGEQEQLNATASPSGAVDQTVVWTSSEQSVATVADGLVTAVGAGTATITATARSNTAAKASCVYTVNAAEEEDDTVAVTAVTMSKTTGSLTVGDTDQLSAVVTPSNAANQQLIWTSSDQNVATVTDGLVTAVGSGNVTIMATAHNGINASCVYTVEEAQESFDMDNYVGKTWTLTGQKWSGEWSFAILMDAANVSVGDTVTCSVSISNANNVSFYAGRNIAGYNHTDTEWIPGSGIGAECYKVANVITESDGVYTGTTTGTSYNEITGQSIIFLVTLATTELPGSFVLEDITLTVNGEAATILDITSYKAEETYTLA